jgi:MoxR-like ATPase
VAGEHAVIIGPPGTAKSALVRTFARLIDARYFEYLLTRFTEPNEIFGPVDIAAFREGRYERRIEGMLPSAEVVFLDEVFKSNSAILNALLTLLNERRFTSGGAVLPCPLLSCFGASNEVPTDDTLTAIFDRFLLRIRSENLDAYHFQDLLQRGITNEVESLGQAPVRPLASAREIAELHRAFSRRMTFSDELLAAYKGLVFQIRAEGVSLSDRRVVKLLKLFAASAFLDGRTQPDAGDFFVLKHIWNNEDQAAILESIVAPVLEAHFRDHPQARRVGASGVGIEALAAEIDRVRQVLTGGGGLSDVQLFSQLKALNEIKAALGASPDPRAPELAKRVDQLLEAAFRSGRFAHL